MGWKKELKKHFQNKAQKWNFDYDSNESSIVIWVRSSETPNSLTLDRVVTLREQFEDDLKSSIQSFSPPIENRKFTYVFNSVGKSEYFDDYFCDSNFENTYNAFLDTHGIYAANLILLMIKKWDYFTTSRFWSVYNSTFSNQSQLNPTIHSRIFEAIKFTGLEAINEMLNQAAHLLETITDLDPYRHYLLIEEIIDLGDGLTWHWSKMLDNVIDAAIEAIYNDVNEDVFYNTGDSLEFDSSFDDFFDKTKTMVLRNETDEAMEYFGLTPSSTENEFKKIYRAFAKQYHPDVNKDQGAGLEMKRINMYKTIIENYYDKARI